MKYACKMIVDRKTGNVRKIAEGRVADGTESHRKYLAPGYTELLHVFTHRENANKALELATEVECWRLETKEARHAELQKAMERLEALRIPHTILARMIGVKRISLDAYCHEWSPVPPRVLVKVRIAVERLENLHNYLHDILPV